MMLRNLTFLAAGLAITALTATGQNTVTNIGKATATKQESPYQGVVVEDIVAKVNDQVISRSDLDRAQQELEQQAKQHNWPDSELEDQKKQLLRDLIDNQLLLSKGKELGITGETETVRQLDDLRKQNHLDSMEDLQKAAEQQGVSFEDFKASIRNRIITSQVIRDEVGRRINISQTEEQQYYDEHKSEFERPAQVRLSEILIPTPNPDDAAQVATAKAKADDAENDLKSGKDFATVAKATSGGPTAAQGGTLGEWKRGQLAKVLEDQTFDLDAGKFTAPIRTKQGYVILKVDENQREGLQPFKDAEPQIQDALGSQKMQPALRAYMTRLREEAFIDIAPGYVDAAASPNEMKLNFSAYTPPQPKKKKKLARTRFGGRGRTVPTQTASAAAPGASAPPAGVPSLADAPQTGAPGQPAAAGTQGAVPPATQTAGATATPAGKTNLRSKKASTTAKVEKPGKKEKIRFGQAPRETLPAGSATSEDAGATTANGNGSAVETQRAAEQAGNSNGSQAAGATYGTGESANEEGPAARTEKTRFSSRANVTKADKKAKKAKAKIDPMAPPPADSDENATKMTQAAPLGLSGDTSKKPAKVKPTTKTRYSDETAPKDDTTQPAAAPATDLPSATPPAPATPSTTPDNPPPPSSTSPTPQN